ncbi:MAG: hypothetical protein E3J72_19330 [Planctomycetota bacterium]|nr:MAG: hypothetical protein E3J72_19330 [Planctomycetota bacterium]
MGTIKDLMTIYKDYLERIKSEITTSGDVCVPEYIRVLEITRDQLTPLENLLEKYENKNQEALAKKTDRFKRKHSKKGLTDIIKLFGKELEKEMQKLRDKIIEVKKERDEKKEIADEQKKELKDYFFFGAERKLKLIAGQNITQTNYSESVLDEFVKKVKSDKRLHDPFDVGMSYFILNCFLEVLESKTQPD